MDKIITMRGRKRIIPLWFALSATMAAAACSGAGGGGSTDAGGNVTLNVAVVSNPDMERMEKLGPEFEKAHPGVKLKFTTLDENTLRDKLSQDVATKSGLFDVVMAGPVELPTWATNGWIASVQDQATKSSSYDLNDIIPSVREALSKDGQLYAVPFYAESSFTMYRKDLFEKARLTMPEQPTWDDIARFAAKLNTPTTAGICLRGQAGWGANMSAFLTAAHSFGARIYDANYQAQFNTPQWKKAATTYIETVKNYGEKGASSASFPECLSAFSSGKAAMWYDATVAASAVTDPSSSKVAKNVGFALAPTGGEVTGGWLWSWALAQVKTSKHPDAAWDFMSWATSKDYVKLVGDRFGANLIPPGTRQSTYDLPEYQKAASAYAELTLKGIQGAKTTLPNAAPKERSFYVDFPEWTDCGTTISQFFTGAIAGKTTVDAALAGAQKAANTCAKDGGYQK